MATCKPTKAIGSAASWSASAVPSSKHHWISTILVLGHVMESGVQLFLCLHYWELTTRWASGLGALLAAAVVLINGASIVGVRRGLDFTDRWFGQCLCYVMHLSLLGLVWRFLKLTFLYDRTDLREFALLRFIQVHLIPFLFHSSFVPFFVSSFISFYIASLFPLHSSSIAFFLFFFIPSSSLHSFLHFFLHYPSFLLHSLRPH